jgi:DNA-binding NarL/FixJ family response regulator
MSASIRVGTADDQELVRTGLRAIMSAESDIEVVGAPDDGVEAVDLARSCTSASRR